MKDTQRLAFSSGYVPRGRLSLSVTLDRDSNGAWPPVAAGAQRRGHHPAARGGAVRARRGGGAAAAGRSCGGRRLHGAPSPRIMHHASSCGAHCIMPLLQGGAAVDAASTVRPPPASCIMWVLTRQHRELSRWMGGVARLKRALPRAPLVGPHTVPIEDPFSRSLFAERRGAGGQHTDGVDSAPRSSSSGAVGVLERAAGGPCNRGRENAQGRDPRGPGHRCAVQGCAGGGVVRRLRSQYQKTERRRER